jgi:ABC-type nitrate/sulfonate/bicarbonate transport system substrate-binding protein
MSMRRSLVTLVAAALLVFFHGSSKAQPLTLKINWAVTPAHLTPLIPLLPKGVYRHYGKSYVVKPIRMRGTGPALTALATGDINIAALSFQGLTVAVLNAKLDIAAIADVLEDHPPNVSDGFWARRAAGIKELKDLRGKVIAVNALGSADDAAIRRVLGEHGITSKEDYHEVEVRFPAMIPALNAGKIDVGFLVMPFALKAEKDPNLHELFTQRQAMGPEVTELWVAKKSFIKAHRAALVDFLEDQILFRRWLKAHRPEMAQLVAGITHRPAAGYASWVMTKDDVYHSPDMRFSLATLQHNIDEIAQLDKLPHTVHAADHVDLSMAKKAAARLGMN